MAISVAVARRRVLVILRLAEVRITRIEPAGRRWILTVANSIITMLSGRGPGDDGLTALKAVIVQQSGQLGTGYFRV